MCRKRNDPLCSEFCDIAEENSSASSEPAPSALPDTSGHFNEDNNAIMSIHAVKHADADHLSVHPPVSYTHLTLPTNREV